jgi:hypothetical protein
MNWKVINECFTTFLRVVSTASCLWITFLATPILLKLYLAQSTEKKPSINYTNNICCECIEEEEQPWEINGKRLED